MKEKRKLTQEHKDKIASALREYRTGKSYVELYGEDKATELKTKHSNKLKGRKRGEFSEEWKTNMSNSRRNSKIYQDWMNSEEYKNKRREVNAMRFYGMSLEEWELMCGDKKLYYLKVRAITKKQKLNTLKDYEKRGTSKNDGYHLDHIYPVSLGYINNIPPEIIGGIHNLRFIPWKENIQKSNKVI